MLEIGLSFIRSLFKKYGSLTLIIMITHMTYDAYCSCFCLNLQISQSRRRRPSAPAPARQQLCAEGNSWKSQAPGGRLLKDVAGNFIANQELSDVVHDHPGLPGGKNTGESETRSDPSDVARRVGGVQLRHSFYILLAAIIQIALLCNSTSIAIQRQHKRG